VTLGDADFWNGPGHAMQVARGLHRAHPGLTFDVTIKVEHLLRHAALLPELAALGCAFVVSAVESLSERVLQLLDKGHNAADVDRALAATRAAGLPLRPTFVPFTPFTTLEDYRALLGWIEARELDDAVDPIQLAIRLLVPPGSLLLQLDELRACLGPLDEERLSYRWTHPDPRMDALERAVFACVEQATRDEEAPALTFARVARLAEAAAHAPRELAGALSMIAAADPVTPRPTGRARPPLPPRLSESWFC
jgi:hypothetical protein